MGVIVNITISEARQSASLRKFYVSHNSMTDDIRFFIGMSWWGMKPLTINQGVKLINEDYIPSNINWTGW